MASPDRCPLCHLAQAHILAASHHDIMIRDAYPVSPDHALVIPGHPVSGFFELTTSERTELLGLPDKADYWTAHRDDAGA